MQDLSGCVQTSIGEDIVIRKCKKNFWIYITWFENDILSENSKTSG